MKTKPLTDHQAEAWLRYQRMRTRLSERLNRELAKETGLSEADFQILTALIELPDEPVRALALRCGLEWEKSRLSHQLRRMEHRGLVTREVCVDDNRGSVIRVTDEGRALAERGRHVHDEAVRHYVFDALDAEQLDHFIDISGAIIRRLEPS